MDRVDIAPASVLIQTSRGEQPCSRICGHSGAPSPTLERIGYNSAMVGITGTAPHGQGRHSASQCRDPGHAW